MLIPSLRLYRRFHHKDRNTTSIVFRTYILLLLSATIIAIAVPQPSEEPIPAYWVLGIVRLSDFFHNMRTRWTDAVLYAVLSIKLWSTGTPKMVLFPYRVLIGYWYPWYFCMSTLGVQKKKELNTLSNKQEIVNIFSLILLSIKPLEYLSFILFRFQCWTLLLFSLLDLGLYSNHHLMVMDVFYYLWLLLNSHMFKKDRKSVV